MNRMRRWLWMLMVLLCGCGPAYRISQYNLAYLYDAREPVATPEVVAFRQSDSTVLVMVRINLGDFRYLKDNTGSTAAAKCQVTYQLRPSYESSTVLDSNSYFLTDTSAFGHHPRIIYSFTIRTKPGQNYLLRTGLHDLNRKSTGSNFLPLAWEKGRGRDCFLAMDTSGSPLFRKFVFGSEKVVLKTSLVLDGSVYVRHFRDRFPVALPPFAVEEAPSFRYAADSVFMVRVHGGITEPFTLASEGIYQFQSDSAGREGLTLFRFGDDYPEVTSTGQTLAALRYLTSGREYGQLRGSSNPKMAVDSFWISTSGNVNRARNLIQKYYRRVEEANSLFASYQEGWKTDRGMIYIIFGPPNVVYRNDFSEKWIYGEPGNTLSIKFTFLRLDNPFTYNDFSLLRAISYKEVWYNAVDNWRR